MPPGLNPIHVLVVLTVALIVLGPEKLPDAARTIGRAVNEFRRWSATMQEEARSMLELATAEEPQPPAPTAIATDGADETPSPLDLNGSAGADETPTPVDLNGSAGAGDAARQ